jgi:hypothetical protein
MERLLRGAGLESEESKAPEYLPMLEAARESALRQADYQGEPRMRKWTAGLANAEMPPGVPMRPPRVFLVRERTYTKGWQKWLLKQGESNRSESDPRVAEGDMLSVMILWLDYSQLTDKLALTAEDEGDVTLRGLYRRWEWPTTTPRTRLVACAWITLLLS